MVQKCLVVNVYFVGSVMITYFWSVLLNFYNDFIPVFHNWSINTRDIFHVEIYRWKATQPSLSCFVW